MTFWIRYLIIERLPNLSGGKSLRSLADLSELGSNSQDSRWPWVFSVEFARKILIWVPPSPALGPILANWRLIRKIQIPPRPALICIVVRFERNQIQI